MEASQPSPGIQLPTSHTTYSGLPRNFSLTGKKKTCMVHIALAHWLDKMVNYLSREPNFVPEPWLPPNSCAANYIPGEPLPFQSTWSPDHLMAVCLQVTATL